MPGPFYNNISGITASAPGTGAFTPSGAAGSASPWSNVPAGWSGLVRFDDIGGAWGLQYSYWNGATLTRSANQFVASSTGSALSLTAAATATMVEDAAEVGVDFTGLPVRGLIANMGAATVTSLGCAAGTLTGTAAIAALANTNFLTRQPRLTLTSATTANAQAGASLATAMAVAVAGGWLSSMRFGASGLPTTPKLLAGLVSATFVGATVEPSAAAASVIAFAKDSTDTDIQLLTRTASGGTSAKVDTGIPWAVGGWYEASLWQDPGYTGVNALLVRLDTGAIWYGLASASLPASGVLLMPQLIAGLAATTGTAAALEFGHHLTRQVV